MMTNRLLVTACAVGALGSGALAQITYTAQDRSLETRFFYSVGGEDATAVTGDPFFMPVAAPDFGEFDEELDSRIDFFEELDFGGGPMLERVAVLRGAARQTSRLLPDRLEYSSVVEQNFDIQLSRGSGISRFDVTFSIDSASSFALA